MIGTSLEMWAADHQGKYPASLQELTPGILKTIPKCNAAQMDTYSASYTHTDSPTPSYVVFCKGANHTATGTPADSPRFTSKDVVGNLSPPYLLAW